jgi:hypothetical protein
LIWLTLSLVIDRVMYTEAVVAMAVNTEAEEGVKRMSEG